MRKRLKPIPTEHFTTTITKVSHEGRGIAIVDGKTTFIFGALLGEEVEFAYDALHSKFNEGHVVNIIKPSSERVKPQCAHFGVCGGCSLQHMQHDAQIALKQKTLDEQLEHFAKTKPKTWLAPLTTNEYGYRHKARLGVRYVVKKDSVLVGFREQSSRYLAAIDNCEVLDPRVGKLITPLRELIQSMAAFEQIAQIEVAMGDVDTALVFRNMIPLVESDQDKLKQFADAHHLMIFLQPAGPNSIYKLYPDDGKALLSYSLPDYHLTFQFHPLEFTQINPEINKKMITQALELLALTPEDEVLDLFCGLGNFTLPIARTAKHVVGVEGSDALVARAKQNAENNDIKNVEFFMADLSQPLDNHAWAHRRYTKILLDPARTGAKEIAEVIQRWNPEAVVYVSCNPATLARDIGLLTERGYTLEKAGIMDMFPQTTHVESMALLRKL
jgi:23S rRNA (uracil1939-C5)-methyltransferase